MKADLSSPRTPFTFAESARFIGGKVIALHDRGCGALQGRHCRCEAVYKIERTKASKR